MDKAWQQSSSFACFLCCVTIADPTARLIAPPASMLSSLLSCVCDVTSDGAVSYVAWVAEGFNLCVYSESWRDIVGAAALGVHILLWSGHNASASAGEGRSVARVQDGGLTQTHRCSVRFDATASLHRFFLYFPQLYRNWNLRSASNHSLLYVCFFLLAEVAFLIASLLQRFAWGWQALRIWRVLAVCILLAQIIYYKSCARTEFQRAVETPYASRIRTANSDDEEDEYLTHPIIGVYEAAPVSNGWPKRKKPNDQQQLQSGGSAVQQAHIGLKHTNMAASQAVAAPNKSAQFGMPPNQWGQSLLSDTDGRSNSPSRSRLPSAQQHLLSQAAPRTISPNQPIRTIRSGGTDSSHSIASSPAESLGTSIDNERRRVAALQQTHQHHSRIASGSLSFAAAPRPPSATTSPAGSFHSSPSSAFRPVIHMDPPAGAGAGSGPGADFSAVTTTTSGYHILSSSSSGSAQEQGGSAAGGSSAVKLATLGLSVLCITMLSLQGVGPAGPSAGGMRQQASMMELSQPSAAARWEQQHQQPAQTMSDAGRSVLSTAAAAAAASTRTAPSFSTALGAFPSLLSSAALSAFSSPDDPSESYCNRPYDPQSVESYVIRVWSWLGVVFFCLALFPQFVYNDSWIHSVAGISFWTYRGMMAADALWIVGIVTPRHNDWIENRYSSSMDSQGVSGDGSFRLDQVILPLTIAQGFHMMACLVLFVQRARFERMNQRRT